MLLFKVGFVIFPDLTQLDFTGPQQVLSRLPDSAMHIVAKTLDPVPSDSGLSLMPTHTLADCPPLDLICVPGGFSVIQAMADRDLIGSCSGRPGQQNMSPLFARAPSFWAPPGC